MHDVGKRKQKLASNYQQCFKGTIYIYLNCVYQTMGSFIGHVMPTNRESSCVYQLYRHVLCAVPYAQHEHAHRMRRPHLRTRKLYKNGAQCIIDMMAMCTCPNPRYVIEFMRAIGNVRVQGRIHLKTGPYSGTIQLLTLIVSILFTLLLDKRYNFNSMVTHFPALCLYL